MDCRHCTDHLIDYASHELAAPKRAEVARHLGECSACALEFCRLSADLEGLTEAHCETPRPEVFAALRRRVAEQVRPGPMTRAARWLPSILSRPIPMYGALLLATVPAGLWLATRMLSPSPSPAPALDPTRAVAPVVLTDYDATAPPLLHRSVL